jgi:hypothetical protein
MFAKSSLLHVLRTPSFAQPTGKEANAGYSDGDLPSRAVRGASCAHPVLFMPALSIQPYPTSTVSSQPHPVNLMTYPSLSSHPYPAILIQPTLSSQPDPASLINQPGSIHHDPSSLIHPTLSDQYRIQPTISSQPYLANLIPPYIQPSLSSQPYPASLISPAWPIKPDPSSLIHPTLSDHGTVSSHDRISSQPYPSLSSHPYPVNLI